MRTSIKEGYITLEDISTDELDLDKTLDSGQSFRWKKDTETGNWVGVINNEITILHQEKLNSTIETNITPDKKEKLIDYLDLNMNYTEEMQRIKMESDEFLKNAYEVGKGIHILKQELFEVMITFIVSQQNTMRNIRNSISKITETYGEKLETTYRNKKYTAYTFPTPEILANTSSLRETKVGFRERYILLICDYLVQNPGYLKDIKEVNYGIALQELKRFKGIGDKVGNCICLFGLHHVNAFPIDTHIKRIIETHYNNSYNKIVEYMRSGIAGIIQQYMFYYKAIANK